MTKLECFALGYRRGIQDSDKGMDRDVAYEQGFKAGVKYLKAVENKASLMLHETSQKHAKEKDKQMVAWYAGYMIACMRILQYIENIERCKDEQT